MIGGLWRRIKRLEAETATDEANLPRPWTRLTFDGDKIDVAAQVEQLHAEGFNIVLRRIVDPPGQPQC